MDSSMIQKPSNSWASFICNSVSSLLDIAFFSILVCRKTFKYILNPGILLLGSVPELTPLNTVLQQSTVLPAEQRTEVNFFTS